MFILSELVFFIISRILTISKVRNETGGTDCYLCPPGFYGSVMILLLGRFSFRERKFTRQVSTVMLETA